MNRSIASLALFFAFIGSAVMVRYFTLQNKMSILALTAVLSACSLDRNFGSKGYDLRVTGKDAPFDFVFEVKVPVLRAMGGEDSDGFKHALEQELLRRKICTSGYVLNRDGTVDHGIYSISGDCKKD